jgi:hypothetical protein
VADVRGESEQQFERVSIRLGGVQTGIVLHGEVAHKEDGHEPREVSSLQVGATYRTIVRRFRPAPPMFPTIIPKQLSDYPQISLIDSRDAGECGLEIHSAQYGCGECLVGVKVLLDKAITRHGLDIVVDDTTMGGDLAPGPQRTCSGLHPQWPAKDS